MEANMIFLLLIMLLVGSAAYSSRKKRNQILCRYRGKDNTVEDKWLDASKDFVIFRGRKFDIDPARMLSFWLDKGLYWLFPTKVNYLDFSFYSPYPHDPKKYENAWLTPQARNAMNTSELVTSFYRTQTPTTTQKKTLLQAYFPFIMLGILLIFFFWVYSNFQSIASTMAAIQNSLNAITR